MGYAERPLGTEGPARGDGMGGTIGSEARVPRVTPSVTGGPTGGTGIGGGCTAGGAGIGGWGIGGV